MKTSSHYAPYVKTPQLGKAVESRNNGHAVSHPVTAHRAKAENTTPVKTDALFQRKAKETDVKPEKLQKQLSPRIYNFKVKQTGKITPIIAIPLGSQGVTTPWNPDGLNTKELLRQKYSEGSKNLRSTIFGYFYTPRVPLSLKGNLLQRQVFVVKRGFDIAVSITNRNEDGTISARRFSPYKDLAVKLDRIVDRMVEDGTQGSKKSARHRINGDIIRVGSGNEILGRYKKEEWPDLAEFAMVIRADKARAPKSTRYYIDENIRQYSTSFEKRFGNGINSIYEGAPKGGAKKLKEKQVLYVNLTDAELTNTRSETLPEKYIL